MEHVAPEALAENTLIEIIRDFWEKYEKHVANSPR